MPQTQAWRLHGARGGHVPFALTPSESNISSSITEPGGKNPPTSQTAPVSRAPGSHANAVARQKAGKVRLDEACVQLYPQYSRKLIQSLILSNKVLVNGQPLSKAGQAVRNDAKIEINAEIPKYVCRGGLKLEAALEKFGIDVTGMVALDSGQSTGGFTDCLLQAGAATVVGIDCGYAQLHERMRRDERVVVMEKFNLRYLTPADIAPHQIDIATLDLSFISVLKVIPAVASVLKGEGSQLVVLIKPQFEAGRAQVGNKGVVKDPKVHKEVVDRVTNGIEAMGFKRMGLMDSPIRGDKSGNLEFLAHFIRTGEVIPTGEAVPTEEAVDMETEEAASAPAA
eukprot:gene22155-29217_t